MKKYLTILILGLFIVYCPVSYSEYICKNSDNSNDYFYSLQEKCDMWKMFPEFYKNCAADYNKENTKFLQLNKQGKCLSIQKKSIMSGACEFTMRYYKDSAGINYYAGYESWKCTKDVENALKKQLVKQLNLTK